MSHTSQRGVGIQCDYQPDVDLLFAWIGDPQAAENVEVEDGIYVRVNRDTREVVGIEVLDCAARFHQDPDAVDMRFAEQLLEQYRQAALDEFNRTNPPTLFSSRP
jgi:uncharacterized protein YuzE